MKVILGLENGKILLTATRRSVEEDTTRGLHAELEEFLGMFDRVLDELLQLFLDRLETSDVLPGNCRHLDNSFSETWVKYIWLFD